MTFHQRKGASLVNRCNFWCIRYNCFRFYPGSIRERKVERLAHLRALRMGTGLHTILL